jgi:hypothetical protein
MDQGADPMHKMVSENIQEVNGKNGRRDAEANGGSFNAQQ